MCVPLLIDCTLNLSSINPVDRDGDEFNDDPEDDEDDDIDDLVRVADCDFDFGCNFGFDCKAISSAA